MTTIPKVPGAWPGVGHAVALWRDSLGFLSSLPSHGDVVEIRIGPHAIIMVCDASLTRQVLLDDRTFDKGGPIFDRGRELLGNGLITCRHSDHRRQRRLTQPSFHQARLPGYAAIMSRHVDVATDTWRAGGLIDVLSTLKNIGARIIAEAVFTTALSSRELDDVVDDFGVFSAGVSARMFLPHVVNKLPTPGNRRYEFARSRLRRNVDDVITRSRQDRTDRGDLLSVLLTAFDSDENAMSEAELHDQVMTFFFAGVETAAVTLAWALHLVGQHAEVEQRLHAEVDSVLGGRAARFEDLPNLEFTRSVIMETLRLYPPTWLVTRTATADTQLGGYTVPAGAVVAYSPYVLHHRGDLHHDPESFEPDRWVANDVPRDSMVPFGGGARKCMGDNFALIETTLMLSGIAARWRLEPVPGDAVRPAPGAFLIPRRLHMRTVARV